MEFFFALSSVKRFVYLLVVTLIAFAAHYYSGRAQSDWLVVSSLIISIVALQGPFWRRTPIILATGIAAAFFSFLADYFGASILFLSPYLFMTTAVSIFFGEKYPDYYFPLIIINLFVIIGHVIDVPLGKQIEKALFIVAGSVIAAFSQLLCSNKYFNHELQYRMEMGLLHLKQLSRDIFACLLDPEYAKNIYLLERRLHIQKDRCMRVIGRWHLYDILLDCAQLRWRVSDHSTFGLCANELSGIEQEIDHIFSEMMRKTRQQKYQINTMVFAEKINRLEENFQNVLQVSSQEPLVFYLFISSLKSLREAFDSFFETEAWTI